MPTSRATFPRLRLAALAFAAVWAPSYAWAYDPTNFLNLCDLAVVLTCIGLWRGSALLLSSQLVGAIVIDAVWGIDFFAALLTGRHPIGGTEYMWDQRFPMWLRALSFFHVAWPLLLWTAVRRTGYDRRGLALQAAVAALALVASRAAGAEANRNFAYTDVLFHRAWGPPPVHLLLTWVALVGFVYLPTHLVLQRLFPARACLPVDTSRTRPCA